jgi:OmpA-OmpF porin, OOP family
MKRKVTLGALAALLTLGTGFAQAASNGPGWYGDIDLGRSNLKLDGSDVDQAFANQGITTSTSIDKHDTALGANLGFRFSRNFALEGGYMDFGKFNYSAAATAPGADTISGDFKAHAWSMSAVGIAPLDGGWALFGKAGLTRVSADLSAGSSTGATMPSSESSSNTGYVFGAGASYDFTRSVYGKAEVDRYTRVGDSGSTGRGDVDLYSIGLGLRF